MGLLCTMLLLSTFIPYTCECVYTDIKKLPVLNPSIGYGHRCIENVRCALVRLGSYLFCFVMTCSCICCDVGGHRSSESMVSGMDVSEDEVSRISESLSDGTGSISTKSPATGSDLFIDCISQKCRDKSRDGKLKRS